MGSAMKAEQTEKAMMRKMRKEAGLPDPDEKPEVVFDTSDVQEESEAQDHVRRMHRMTLDSVAEMQKMFGKECMIVYVQPTEALKTAIGAAARVPDWL